MEDRLTTGLAPTVLRPTWARVDLARLARNLEQVRAVAGHTRPVLAVVKANAYGHGAIPVARTLEAAGVRAFGVALVEEGLELRRAGIRADLLVLGLMPVRGVRASVEAGLIAAVFDLETARALDAAAAAGGVTARVHVKVDTGMGRLGVRADGVEELAAGLRSLPRLAVEGIFTTLAAGDDPTTADRQLQALDAARQLLQAAGFRDLAVHAANSAALAASDEALLDLVRPGLALYGLGGRGARLSVDPVLSLETEIGLVKTLPKGAPVGYGGTFVCARETRLATLPIGYDDGLPRLLSGTGEVLVRGRRSPIVGRVSMDLTTIDVTGIEGVRAGDRVVVIGEDGAERITAEDVAARAETIAWEVLCRIGSRVPRTYSGPSRAAAGEPDDRA